MIEAAIEETLRGQDGVFIDGGAHVGSFSLLALHAMRDGVAHAFEMEERVLRCLRKNAAASGGKLVLHEGALGAEAGMVQCWARLSMPLKEPTL